MIDNIVNEYLLYHAITLIVITLIITLFFVHRRGSEINMQLAR